MWVLIGFLATFPAALESDAENKDKAVDAERKWLWEESVNIWAARGSLTVKHLPKKDGGGKKNTQLPKIVSANGKGPAAVDLEAMVSLVPPPKEYRGHFPSYAVDVTGRNTGTAPFRFDIIEVRFFRSDGKGLSRRCHPENDRDKEQFLLLPGERFGFTCTALGCFPKLEKGGSVTFGLTFFFRGKIVAGPFCAPIPVLDGAVPKGKRVRLDLRNVSSDKEKTISIGAEAPWKIECGKFRPVACPSKDGWLLPKVSLDAKCPKVLIRLDLADVPGLDGRAPVKVEEFSVVLDCPRELAGNSSVSSGWAMFAINEQYVYREPTNWRFVYVITGPTGSRKEVELGGDWMNICGRSGYSRFHRKVLPQNFSPDTTSVGVYVSLNANALPDEKFEGTFGLKIERLTVSPSAPPRPNLPGKGEVLKSLGAASGWSADRAYKGCVSASVTKGVTRLMCDLDATDPARLSAVARLPISPRDMRTEGLFVTVDIPEGLAGAGKFKSGIHAGVSSHDGKEVFWGPWRTIARPGPVTVAIYPEIRFPLPLAFRSAGFDPSKVAGICVRITVDQATRMKYKGPVIIRTAQIVKTPKSLLDKRDEIARNVDKTLRPPQKKAAATGKVRIRDFVKNIGLNYPWPPDIRGEGIYPVIPARCWGDDGKEGGLELVRKRIEEDFAMYARNKVALVRVWLLCDLRRSLVKDAGGNSVLDKDCWRKDLGILLKAAQANNLELVPTLLDFGLADGSARERLGAVGEEPRILTDPAARKAFLKSIAPLIDELCNSKAVRYIDLFNEPGQMSVPMDAVLETLGGLAELVRKRKPVTVGVRNSVELSWWTARLPIDVPTFHWFAKMERGARYPKAWAPKDVPRGRTIISEIEATRGVSATLTECYEAGWLGALFWSANGNDGISPFGVKQAEELRQWVEQHIGTSDK